ncbi:alpha/beta hydrolase family protein [Streptomyces sp. NPDC087538]|uniref:alpha/beta hydrolase family protein n=1 Tax=Streptomyces sp. NPDC087538 TaxID=3365797 RepID=UPI00381306AB
MTYVSQEESRPSRRTALTGLTGLVGWGGAALAAGCTPANRAPSAQGPSPAPTASATRSPAGTTPGAMTLFQDPAFNFNGLWALGGAGFGGSEVGEVLTAVNAINKAGLSAQTYVETFKKLGDRLMGAPRGSRPDRRTRRFRALRAAQYYAQALFFVLGSDAPAGEAQLYKSGRGAWDTFCELSDPAPVTSDVPYGQTPLPVWFFRPDDSGKQRPTVVLTNGSDGQNVDMWAYGVAAALERDWNALVYDGPGQGQLLFVNRVVFTPRWETVVTPLVDWLVARSDVDADLIVLTGLSMAGNLAPRAAAFEKRIAALVAMPGCLEPWLGFPPEIRKILAPSKAETNDIWNKEVVPGLSAADAATMKKRFEPFSVPAMLAAREGKVFTDFYTPAKRIESLTLTSVVDRITMPTLVLDYEYEQFYPGQPRRMFDRLTSPKDYVRLTAGTGAQLHCSPMAPQQHCDVVFDWLQEKLPGR